MQIAAFVVLVTLNYTAILAALAITLALVV
jgi:hypothetical protein